MKLSKTKTVAQIEPIGCKGKSVSPKAIRRFLEKNPGKYIAEEKKDGHRYLLHVNPHGDGVNYLTSRRISKQTGLFGEKQNKLPFMRDWKFSAHLNGFVFDGEITGGAISSDTSHEIANGRGVYHVWDIAQSPDGLQTKPWQQRKNFLQGSIAYFPHWMFVVPHFYTAGIICETLAHYQVAGKEGIILKRTDLSYEDSRHIKVKFEDTADAIITGYTLSTEGKYANEGWIKSVQIAEWFPEEVFNKKFSKLKVVRRDNGKVLAVIGNMSGFDEELREKFSTNKKHYLNKVVEFKFQLRFKSGKFRHPRYMRFRPDKAESACVYKAA